MATAVQTRVAPVVVAPVTVHQPSGGSTFRPDIEGLRALAILLVVLFHADVPGIKAGFIGVDVFFVISGFLIAGVAARFLAQPSLRAAGELVARRLGRLIPAASLLLIALAIVGAIVLPLSDRSALGSATVASSLGRMDGFVQDTFTETNGQAPQSLLQQFWSLSLEWQFYGIAFGALLAAVGLAHALTKSGRYSARTWRHVFVIAALIAGTYLSFRFSVTFSEVSPPLAYFSLWTRLWEFGAGALCLVALTYWRPTRYVALATAAAGVTLLYLGNSIIGPDRPFPGQWALYPVLGTVALIIAGASANPVSRFLGHPIAAHVGSRSYSWYVWHWPLLMLVWLLYDRPSWPVGLLIVAVAYGIAELSTRWLEQPVRRWSRRAHPATVITAMVGVSAATVGAGLLLA